MGRESFHNPGAVVASTCITRNDARPDEHEASLIHAKKVNAKPKSFSRIENMVNSMLVNPIASFGAAMMTIAATEKSCGNCGTCKTSKSLDLAIV